MTDLRQPVSPKEWQSLPEADVNLELPGALALALDRLEWDSRFFGLPCYRLCIENCRLGDGPVDVEGLKRTAVDLPRCAIWAKMSPWSHPDLAMAFQALGGIFIETEITFAHNGTTTVEAATEGARIHDARHLDHPGFTDLGMVFSLTRFHLDPHVGAERANVLWTEYLKSYDISADGRAFLAEDQGRIVGAVLASKAKSVNVIDIVAVAPTHASIGIGRALVHAAISWSLPTGIGCTVATQHRNTEAIAFYQACGFTHLVSATPVFHLWPAGPGGGS